MSSSLRKAAISGFLVLLVTGLLSGWAVVPAEAAAAPAGHHGNSHGRGSSQAAAVTAHKAAQAAHKAAKAAARISDQAAQAASQTAHQAARAAAKARRTMTPAPTPGRSTTAPAAPTGASRPGPASPSAGPAPHAAQAAPRAAAAAPTTVAASSSTRPAAAAVPPLAPAAATVSPAQLAIPAPAHPPIHGATPHSSGSAARSVRSIYNEPLALSGGRWPGVSLRAATKLSVPILFGAVVALFVLVQAFIDRRDPKLARAPERGEDDTVGFG